MHFNVNLKTAVSVPQKNVPLACLGPPKTAGLWTWLMTRK